MESKLEIAEKEVLKYKAQIDENKKINDKEVKSLQNQIRSAYSEMQRMKKNKLESSTTLEGEVDRWKEK